MIRIITGKWRGKKLLSPEDATTRPTRDRVREALFSMLDHVFAHDWSHKTVVDAFAGTGALGLEALSRGAQICYFVESHVAAFKILKQNMVRCKVPGIAIWGTFEKALKEGKLDQKCHLVFLDPPYDKKGKNALLVTIKDTALLAPGGIICFELPKDEILALPDGYEIVTERIYGITKITIIRGLFQ